MKKVFLCALLCGWLSSSAQHGTPQQSIVLTDMSGFQATGKNWRIAGDASADLDKNGSLSSKDGSGVLVNLPDKENNANLLSVIEHGDADISFDFMMAKHSNSGFYLQGRYEVQLLDSWGVKNPTSGDCGGVYQRRELPSGRMYEGFAPRANACKAPGLWQHFDISFQAPRFDASGKKTSNAKVLRIALNGVVLHENIELSGPTGGPISEDEAAKGPFMIQGDHGAVAFKNFKIRAYSGENLKVLSTSYQRYETTDNQLFATIPDFSILKPAASGNSDITWEVSSETNNFGEVFTGKMKVPTSGDYRFWVSSGGISRLKINGANVLGEAWGMSGNYRSGTVKLEAGEVPYELVYVKKDDWVRPALGLEIEGPGFRRIPLHAAASMLASAAPDPILVSARENTILRSFMDVSFEKKPSKRVVHAVQVGHYTGLHYTFDLDNGALVQAWRGEFLDATPMWDNRGDGSSKPMGVIVQLHDAPAFAELTTPEQAWPTAPAGFTPKGYDTDTDEQPTFRYFYGNVEITDAVRVAEKGKYLNRELIVRNPSASLQHLITSAKSITQLQPDLYFINEKEYYVRATGATLRTGNNGQQELLMPAGSGKIQYSVIF